jgi:hypothetical protein
VAENRNHFWRLNFIQKLGDCLQQLFWLVEGLADERISSDDRKARSPIGQDQNCKVGEAHVQYGFQ